MKSDEGKAVYKQRSPAELPHARLRAYGLRQFTLRSAAKALIQATWAALASNLVITFGIKRRNISTPT
jgi:Transposase DDE domain